MTLLIHVAGNADLGIAARLPQDKRHSIREGRLKELDQNTDPEAIASRLLDMTYDVAREEMQCGVNVNPEGLSATPLGNELKALAALGGERNIRILVIGTGSEDGATETLAHTLEKGIVSIRPIIESRYGLTVSSVEAVILPSLFERDWILPVEEKIAATGPEERLILPLAGGANSIVMGVAGMAIASGHDLALLLAKKKNEEPHAYSLRLNNDPVRGWLLGLGLPTVMKGRRRGADEVREAAVGVTRAFSDENPEDRADALGQLLLMDVARGDLAAGMSIRAWLLAEFRRRLEDDGFDVSVQTKKYRNALKNGSLPSLIAQIECRPEPDRHAAERWLLDRKALLPAGERATHDFASLFEDEEAERTRREVRQGVGEGKVPTFLSWPNEHICLIYGIGTKPQQLERGEFAVELMAKEPAEEFRLACAVARPLQVHSVLLASTDSTVYARRVVNEINDHTPQGASGHPWARGTAEMVCYGASAVRRDTNERIEDLINSVRDKVKKNLDTRKPRPRAIVVGTLGEKEALVGALSAAQNYGAQWGVPVFLVSSVKREEGEEFQFHRFGLGDDAKLALLTGAHYCMERLDLLTAHRLLALGDREMRGYSSKAKILGKCLAETVNAQQIDDHAALIADVYKTIAALCASSDDETLRTRLATIAGELIFKGKNQEEPVLLKRAAKGDFKVHSLENANLGQLLSMIYQVRSETPLNHGQGTLDRAFKTMLGKRVKPVPGPSAMTYSRLLEIAAVQIGAAIKAEAPSDPATATSSWKNIFDELHTWIQEALDA